MNKTPFEKAGDFLLGRGFYIVLFLCVATIGFSGYYLITSLTPDTGGNTISPVAATPEITLPDPVIATTPPAEVVVEEPIVLPDIPEEPVEETPAPVTPPVQQTESPVVYTWPVKGEVIRSFSTEVLSRDDTMGDWRTHDGIDIAASLGTSVLSPSRGTVLSVTQDEMMGYTVVIQHPDDVVSTLSNLSSVTVVKEGDTVETGTVIGAVGDSALAESGIQAHLHLEFTQDGTVIDPLLLLP